MILKTDVPGLVKSINDRLDHILRAEIEYQMREALKPMVEEAAKAIAVQLRGMIYGVHDRREDKIHLMVKVDGVEQVIPPKLPKTKPPSYDPSRRA